MDCGSNTIFQSFDFDKRARTFKLNSFEGLISDKRSGQFS